MKPARLVADTAYGTTLLLGWLVDTKQIAPHIPVWGKAQRSNGASGRADFVFDAQHDRYQWPTGKYLHTAGQVTANHTILYRARQADCRGCKLKQTCCPNTGFRRIARSIQEQAHEVARAIDKDTGLAGILPTSQEGRSIIRAS
jgi:hypothetical protein